MTPPPPPRVVILGSGGLEGRAATAFLLRRNCTHIALVDEKPHDVPEGCTGSFGPTYLSALEHADVIVRSPGVRTDTPELRAAVKRGAILTSGTRMLLEGCPALGISACPARVVAVTGSNGKTTCTSLLFSTINRSWARREVPGRVWLGGNIGTPVLDLLDQVRADDLVILELSSFQLDDVERSPWLGVVLNVTPNHLDWHPGFDAYVAAKKRAIDQHGNAWAVLSLSDSITRSWADERSLGTRLFDDAIIDMAETGPHISLETRDENGIAIDVRLRLDDLRFKTHPGTMSAAIHAAALLGANAEDIESAFLEFTGIEHRLQSVRMLDEVDYVDDSANTTPESAIVALRAYPKSSVVILLGGSDKGTPFDALAREVVERKARVVVLGQVAPQIVEAIAAIDPNAPVSFRPEFQVDFQAVMEEARHLAKPGDHVLLSTGCASFGMFQNYKHRASEFTRIVQAWAPKA